MLEDAKLWLLRHGISDGKRDENSYAEDFVRMLTPKGAKQAIRAGKLLEHLGEKPAAVYTSPRVRCLQTAQLACAAFGPDFQPVCKKVLDEVAERQPNQAVALAEDGETVLLSGHGPEWKRSSSTAPGAGSRPSAARSCSLHFRKGQATLEQLLTPADIKRLVADVLNEDFASQMRRLRDIRAATSRPGSAAALSGASGSGDTERDL
jgi:phosphohistidine phosphatase SixA